MSIRSMLFSTATLCISLAAAGPGLAQTVEACAGLTPSAGFETREISENGLVARYSASNAEEPVPGVIVLGGSEGGTRVVRALGEAFAEEGYGVLALSYFGAEGLPDTLQDIPVEYFRTAIDWLAEQPGIDAGAIGVYGLSKGGEAALLLASRDDRISRVAAGVPSHVVWQGINMQSFEARSSWSEGREPLPYLPYDMSNGFRSVFALYDDALPGLAPDDPAIIPVEEIAGPVLLISGAADTLWPSAKMADRVVARLQAEGFDHAVQHLKYEEAGHGVAVPPSLGAVFGGSDSFLGGTDEGNAAGRQAMWQELRCFFATGDE